MSIFFSVRKRLITGSVHPCQRRQYNFLVSLYKYASDFYIIIPHSHQNLEFTILKSTADKAQSSISFTVRNYISFLCSPSDSAAAAYLQKKVFGLGFERKTYEVMLLKATRALADKWTRGNCFRDNSNANEGPVIFCLGTFLRDVHSPLDVKLIWISIAHRSRGAHVHFFSNQMALNFVHSFLVFLVG